jgi:hypothetical protein
MAWTSLGQVADLGGGREGGREGGVGELHVVETKKEREGGREEGNEGGRKGGRKGGEKRAYLPHECLSIRADLGDDGTELGLEAHVKHAIGLVQHQVGDAAEVGHPCGFCEGEKYE